MGVFDDIVTTLFGGSEQESQPKDVTPPELQSIRGPFAETLKALFGGTGSAASLAGIPGYGGPLVAPITPGEEEAIGAFDINDPLQAQRRATLTAGMRGDFARPDDPLLQEYIRAAQRPTLQGLEEVLSRTLPGRFTQAGQFVQPQGSGAFDRSAALLSRAALQESGDIATKIALPAVLQGRSEQQGYVQLGQQEVQSMIANLQAKALPRLIADMGIERGIEEFKARITNLLQALSIATNAPLQNVAQKTTETTTQGVVPGVASLLSGYGTYKHG